MASRRETEQSKSKDAEEEVIIFFARSMSVAMLILGIFNCFVFFEFFMCDVVFTRKCRSKLVRSKIKSGKKPELDG